MGMEAAELRYGGRLRDIRAFIDSLYGRDLHAKRVDSLAAATLGVMTGASLAVAMIGQALAQARGLVTKHAIKQVDRLLSNSGIDVWATFARWVPHLVGSRNDIVVAMDWTDFDGDDQATLALNLVTEHGRAMPLLWLSVWKHELKDQRNAIEDTCLRRLSEVVPPGCRVTILADRGFGDHSCSRISPILALPMSFASAATSMSPIPPARREPRRTGSADRGGRASCAAPASPHRTPIRSAPWCVCMHVT